MSKYVFKPYNPLFPQLFQREKERIALYVKDLLCIEHVGSTSVPGLGGKGIIDIAIAMPNKEAIVSQLQELGYEFRPRFSTQERLYFVIDLPDPEEGVRRYHVHVMSDKSSEWQDFLSFRDALRADPQLMQEYAALKEQAAGQADGMGAVYRKWKEPLFAKILGHCKKGGSQ